MTAAVRGAFDEMSNAQKVSAQTSAVLKSTGGVANVTAGHVDTLATSLLNLSGVDDEVIKSGENMLLTFRNIRNQAGAGNDIFDQATKAALDMSVAFKEDVPSAAKQLGKALQDPVRGITALRRVGIQFTDSQQKQIKALVASGRTLEAQKIILREVNKETGGSARALGDTLGGKLNILRESVLNLAGAFVQTLTPSIENLLDRANKWITNSENQKRVMNDLKQVAGAVKDVFNVLKGVFEGLNSITGSTKNTLKLLFGVLVAYKTLKLVSTFAGIASNIGLIGTNAASAAGTAGRLSGVLTSLSTMGPIGIAIAITVTAFTTAPFVTRQLNKFFEAAGIRTKHSPLGTGPLGGKSRPVWRHGRLVWSGSGTPYGGEDRDPGGRLAGGTRAPSQDPFTTARGAFAQPPPTLPGAGGGRGGSPFTRAQRNAFFDAKIGRTLTRAQYKELQGQLADYQKVAALLTRRIATTKDVTRKLKLEDQLLSVQAQIRSTRAELAANAVQAAHDRAEKVRAAAEKAAARRAAAAARRQGRQFRALGFGPGGEDLVPGVAALRKRLVSIRNLPGLTAKMRSQIERIGKVLAGKWGEVGKDVRAKIKEMIDGIRNELQGGAEGVIKRPFVHVDPSKMLEGLGLSPHQIDLLRSRLSPLGPGRTLPGTRTPAFAGAGGGTVINGPVNIYGVQDMRAIENEFAKRQGGRASNRRGAR